MLNEEKEIFFKSIKTPKKGVLVHYLVFLSTISLAPYHFSSVITFKTELFFEYLNSILG